MCYTTIFTVIFAKFLYNVIMESPSMVKYNTISGNHEFLNTGFLVLNRMTSIVP